MIRWITPFLGTAPASSVVLEPNQRLLDVRDLVDREGNALEEIRKKIKEGLDLLRDGSTVIVGCDYGISRSNAIAAGLLSAYGKMSFDRAVRQVIQATGELEIKLSPLNMVRLALGEGKKTNTQGPRILLTGGSGFIGTVLHPMLEERWPVFAPSKSEMNLVEGAALLDLQVRELSISHLVHLAAPRVYASNRALGETIAMLRNVLDVCRENGIHLIYPSSGEIYSGYCSDGIKVDKQYPPNPKGPYGETKWLCELLIGQHRREYRVRCGLLRSSFLYGAGADRPRFLRTFIANARAGMPIYTHEYRNGFPCLDLMHVNDFCRAISAAIQNGFEGDANLGTGRLISTRRMAILIRDLLGSETRKVNDEAPNIAMEIAAAYDLLSWTPSIAFEEGLAEIFSPQRKEYHHIGEDHVRLER
jgi:nucleoside-diphosphate-sugar epimerase